MAVPDAELDRLYGGDLEEFVAARAATAKELRRQGRRDEAAAVAALRKPSVAAAIVNRLARADAGLLDELLTAGARLREVQLGGAAPHELRAAVTAETRALDALMRAAGEIAARPGAGGQAALERVRETLHAAALDPELATEVRRGVLVREQQAVGFPMGVVVPASRRSPPAARRPKPAPRRPVPQAKTDAVAAKRLARAAAQAAEGAAKLAQAEAGLGGGAGRGGGGRARARRGAARRRERGASPRRGRSPCRRRRGPPSQAAGGRLMVVHLVDGTYELFRQFYGRRRGAPRGDRRLGAVIGVLHTVLGMIETGAVHVGVATDHVIESFRNDLWAGYKTGAGVDPALRVQFEPARGGARRHGRHRVADGRARGRRRPRRGRAHRGCRRRRPRAVINALQQLTDVRILSNPSLVVVDNGDASLEVGDQVPVSTGSATVLSANNAVVNTVDYKNTGIILHVQPHVNSNGSVLLDIDQEISSVPQNSTSLTPTISTRKVQSQISVVGGQTVMLAGLISDQQEKSREGIPLLNQLPYLGAAFGTTGKTQVRTELIIFIRPQVIRNGVDAAEISEELRSKMRGGRSQALTLPAMLNINAR